MVELTTGDILKANAEPLVNTVNCDGFMGRGIVPTKRHWRSRSRLEDIESGLAALAKDIRRLALRSAGLPLRASW